MIEPMDLQPLECVVGSLRSENAALIRELAEALRAYEAEIVKEVVGFRFAVAIRDSLTLKDSCVLNCACGRCKAYRALVKAEKWLGENK